LFLDRTKGVIVKSKLVHAASLATAALALILLVTACGGGNGNSEGVASLDGGSSQGTTAGDGATTSSQEDREEAALEWARCMREHGVDVPDPVNGRIEVRAERENADKVQQAQEACGDILQNAAPPLSEEQEQAMEDALLAFAQCMREHGIDMPDPQRQEGGGFLTRMPEGAEDDPKFQEAQEACQPIVDEAAREAGLPEPEGGPEPQRSGGGS
jgi:hypothetical protein